MRERERERGCMLAWGDTVDVRRYIKVGIWDDRLALAAYKMQRTPM